MGDIHLRGRLSVNRIISGKISLSSQAMQYNLQVSMSFSYIRTYSLVTPPHTSHAIVHVTSSMLQHGYQRLGVPLNSSSYHPYGTHNSYQQSERYEAQMIRVIVWLTSALRLGLFKIVLSHEDTLSQGTVWIGDVSCFSTIQVTTRPIKLR